MFMQRQLQRYYAVNVGFLPWGCMPYSGKYLMIQQSTSGFQIIEDMEDFKVIKIWGAYCVCWEKKVACHLQYIPRNMHTVFALLCFAVVIHWLIFPYPSGLLHWHCGNLTIAPVPAKQPWWIWINTPCKFIMNDCITTTKQSTTKPCAYFLGYTVAAIAETDTQVRYHIIKSFKLIWRWAVVDEINRCQIFTAVDLT